VRSHAIQSGKIEFERPGMQVRTPKKKRRKRPYDIQTGVGPGMKNMWCGGTIKKGGNYRETVTPTLREERLEELASRKKSNRECHQKREAKGEESSESGEHNKISVEFTFHREKRPSGDLPGLVDP